MEAAARRTKCTSVGWEELDSVRIILEFLVVCTNVVELTFLPVLYIWTDASILSYVTVSEAKYLIPEIIQNCTNMSICRNCISLFLANANTLS